MKEAGNKSKQKVAPLAVVLSIVFVFFCSVLVYVYAATKRINPVMLDEHGHRIQQTAKSSDGGAH